MVVQKCFAFMTHIDETGIECGHDLLDLPGVDVAYGVLAVLTFSLELNEFFIFEQGYGYFLRLSIDD